MEGKIGKNKKHLYCLDLDNLEEGKHSIWGVENDDNY